jgi:hypothetical protein
MASKILVDELAPQSHATDVTLATGKNITGANTQFKITGGANTNILTTDGAGALSWSAQPTAGLAEFDQWYLPTDFTGSVFPITTMARLNFGPFGAPAGTVGTGMGHSSGTFSFPSTGKWLITFYMLCTATTTADSGCNALIKMSINTGGSYTQYAASSADTPAIGANAACNMTATYLMDIPNISTHLVQIGSSLEAAGNTVQGAADDTSTNVTFMKVS